MDRVTWGDFEVDFEALLGRGGMGAVYKGRQISLDRPVAIKILDTSHAPTDEFEEGFRQKFETEARALARIHDPRIISVFQAGRNDGKFWYAMELIDGTTVEERITQDGMFAEPDAARAALDVARALDAAWREKIIHRDVKPANIFLLRAGGTKLGDFGIARTQDAPPSRLTEANAIVGTPTYVSPEQGLGDACDHRADIYSLGVCLYEMLTERPPFAGISPMETVYKHANEQPQSPRLLNPAVTPAMEAVILRCLAKEKDERYQTYAELIDDLDAIVAGREPEHVNAPAVFKSRAPSAVSWLLACLGTGLLALILAAIYATPAREAIAAKQPDPPKQEPANPEPPKTEDPKPEPPKTLDPKPEPPKPPPIEEIPLEKRLAQYKPSDAELAMLRRLTAIFAAQAANMRARFVAPIDDEVRKLADDPAHTEYTKLLAKGAVELVGLARRAIDGRHRKLAESESATVKLSGGDVVSGHVVTKDPSSVTLEADGKRSRVLFADLALDEYEAQPRAAIAVRAVCGEPVAKDEPLWIPWLVPIAAESAGAHARASRFAQAKAMLQFPGVVELFGWLDADAKSLVREREAIVALEADRLEHVLVAFEGTHAHPHAAARVIESFRAAAKDDLFANAESVMAWELAPDERTPKERLRFWDVEDELTILRDAKGLRSLVRKEDAPTAPEGLLLAYRLKGGHARLSLASSERGSTHLRVEAARVELRQPLFESQAEAKALAAARIAESADWRELAVVPLGERVFVYVDGLLALHASRADAGIPRRFALGVSSGELVIRSLKVR